MGEVCSTNCGCMRSRTMNMDIDNPHAPVTPNAYTSIASDSMQESVVMTPHTKRHKHDKNGKKLSQITSQRRRSQEKQKHKQEQYSIKKKEKKKHPKTSKTSSKSARSGSGKHKHNDNNNNNNNNENDNNGETLSSVFGDESIIDNSNTGGIEFSAMTGLIANNDNIILSPNDLLSDPSTPEGSDVEASSSMGINNHNNNPHNNNTNGYNNNNNDKKAVSTPYLQGAQSSPVRSLTANAGGTYMPVFAESAEEESHQSQKLDFVASKLKTHTYNSGTSRYDYGATQSQKASTMAPGPMMPMHQMNGHGIHGHGMQGGMQGGMHSGMQGGMQHQMAGPLMPMTGATYGGNYNNYNASAMGMAMSMPNSANTHQQPVTHNTYTVNHNTFIYNPNSSNSIPNGSTMASSSNSKTITRRTNKSKLGAMSLPPSTRMLGYNDENDEELIDESKALELVTNRQDRAQSLGGNETNNDNNSNNNGTKIISGSGSSSTISNIDGDNNNNEFGDLALGNVHSNGSNHSNNSGGAGSASSAKSARNVLAIAGQNAFANDSQNMLKKQMSLTPRFDSSGILPNNDNNNNSNNNNGNSLNNFNYNYVPPNFNFNSLNFQNNNNNNSNSNSNNNNMNHSNNNENNNNQHNMGSTRAFSPNFGGGNMSIPPLLSPANSNTSTVSIPQQQYFNPQWHGMMNSNPNPGMHNNNNSHNGFGSHSTRASFNNHGNDNGNDFRRSRFASYHNNPRNQNNQNNHNNGYNKMGDGLNANSVDSHAFGRLSLAAKAHSVGPPNRRKSAQIAASHVPVQDDRMSPKPSLMNARNSTSFNIGEMNAMKGEMEAQLLILQEQEKIRKKMTQGAKLNSVEKEHQEMLAMKNALDANSWQSMN